MRINSRALVSVFFAVALTGLGAVQFYGTEALAQSTFFTSRGCVDCHSAPTVATCNGCHHHGNSSLRAATDKTSYAPGETVTATLSGGSRSGWIRAVLYDQNNVQIAISSGNASGMGSSTTFPAPLTASAPTAPGTYTWKMAYFGNQDGTGTGDVHSEVRVNTNSFTVASAVDTTVPVVGAFTIPATSTSLTVPVSSLTATDNVAVTGYLVTTSATAPLASAAGWSATAPTSVTAPAVGFVTFFAWAKDAAGNVSASRSAAVSITLPDITVPVVGAFTLPVTSASLTVPVSSLTATDNVAVTGYLVNTSATKPLATAAGWTASAPASVTAPAAGSVTFFAWAKDAAGNVSASRSAAVTITLPDMTAPVVNTFTLPATANSLTVPVTALIATDNLAVTGYMVTTSSTTPLASAAGWTATSPVSVTAPAAGSITFFAWAKDAAGNVSGGRGATVNITLPDTTVPVVGTFTLPSTSTSLTVPVSSLTATDNIAVTGYLVTTSATAPLASAAGWTATAPASVPAPAAGSVTFFAWAKDAGGNISASRSATVSITLPDTAAPVVGTFTLPASATNLTVIVNSFTATDNVGVTGYLVTTSATAPAASAGGWTSSVPASVAAPSAGSVTFYAWAKDAAGNVSAGKSATANITLPDATAPVVTSFAIPATATTLTVPVNVLTATDNVGVTGYMVTTSGAVMAASAGGWTSAPPATVTAPAEGNVTFYAWARDAAGNVSLSRSATVVITTATENDTTKPALSVSALADGSSTNKPTLNVTGTATDAGGLDTVTVNGQNVPVNADGSFSTALNLVSGTNTVAVVATDKAGNQESNSRSITYDASIPVLTVADPADNSTSVQSFLTVSGTINETSTVSVKVNNGSPQSASISGSSFSATVNLASGINTIEITATDLAGNTSSAKRTVSYDGGNFTLAVTYPSQDITTSKSSLVLTGKIADATSRVKVTITMDGRTYTPRVAYGVFRQRLYFPRAKLYAITVKATDAAGNSSSVVRNVIYRNSDDDEHDDD